MLKPSVLPLLALALLVGLPSRAQSLDQILAAHFKALGGEANVRAVQSLRLEGKVDAGEPSELPFTRLQKRPLRSRDEVKVSGQVIVQGFDGRTAWRVNPLSGKKDAEILGEEARKDQAYEADLDGPLLDWKAKGHRVELMGKEDVEGTATWKLKVALNNGDLLHLYLDTDSLMIIKEEMKQIVRGTEHESETYLGDYRKAGGVYYAGAVESGPKGSTSRSKTLVEKIQVNPPLADALFQVPAPAARP